jgi:hypothetical protein
VERRLSGRRYWRTSRAGISMCILFCFIWDRVSLCSSGWLWTQNSPACTSWMLELKAWPGLCKYS